VTAVLEVEDLRIDLVRHTVEVSGVIRRPDETVDPPRRFTLCSHGCPTADT
jgi:hypothetical protein